MIYDDDDDDDDNNNNNNNTEKPALSHVLNNLAPNCHTKLVTSLYFEEEKWKLQHYPLYNELQGI